MWQYRAQSHASSNQNANEGQHSKAWSYVKFAALIHTRDLGSENLLTLREFPGHAANGWRKLKVFGVPGVWHTVRAKRLSRSGSIIA